MNAVTTTEAQAVHTAASSAANMLQAADPSKHMILVPLSRLVLRPTGRNVRKTVPRMSIPELAASIQRVGLLQNLIVIPAADGLHYEVVAGGRRLAALKLLAKKHRIAKDWNVPCLLTLSHVLVPFGNRAAGMMKACFGPGACHEKEQVH